MTTFAARTEIDVPPEAVWAALMDMERWSEWASFHPEPAGEVAVGERVTVRFSVRGRLRINGRARFIDVRPGRALWWEGGLAPLLRVIHGFELEPTDEGGTRLLHEERFEGPLGPLVVRLLGPRQESKYDAVNRALGRYVRSRL